MAQHVKVAVAGDGADELFGSYLSHRVAAGAEALPDGLPSDPDWAWRADLLVMSDEEKYALYSPDVRARLVGVSTRDHVRLAFGALTARDPLNRVLEAEFHGILPDQVLTFVDRLSMAHSLGSAQRVSGYRGGRIRGRPAGLVEDSQRRDQVHPETGRSTVLS